MTYALTLVRSLLLLAAYARTRVPLSRAGFVVVLLGVCMIHGMSGASYVAWLLPVLLLGGLALLGGLVAEVFKCKVGIPVVWHTTCGCGWQRCYAVSSGDYVLSGTGRGDGRWDVLAEAGARAGTGGWRGMCKGGGCQHARACDAAKQVGRPGG